MTKTKPTKINTKVILEWDGEKYVETYSEGFEYTGPVAQAGGGSANTGTEAWHFYATDNSTSIAAQDTTPVSLNVDTTYVVRVRVANTGTKDESSTTFDLYAENTTQATGAFAVTGSSTHVQAANPTGITDGTAITSATLTGGSGTWLNGEEVEDGVSASLVIALGEYTEFWYGFTLVSADVANNDNIAFSVRMGSTALDFDAAQAVTVVEATTYGGTATFTGSGSVTATGATTSGGTASFTGAGSFTGVGAYIPGVTVYPGTATFTGTGSLSATGSVKYPGTASFTGSGSLTATGSQTYGGAASFTGGSTFTGSGQSSYGATATFTGTGSFTGVGQHLNGSTVYPGTATFTGAGSVTGSGATTYSGTASFTGTTSLTASGSQIYGGLATFTGASSLNVAGQAQYGSTADFTGTGSFTAVGQYISVGGTTYPGVASFVGSGSIAATGEQKTVVTGGGKPKRKRKKVGRYLSLPDGSVVEVDSKKEAQRLLDAYYEAVKPSVKKPKLKAKTTKKKAEKVGATQTVYYAPQYTPIEVKPITPLTNMAVLESNLKRKKQKRQDEEAILLLIA